MLQINQMIKQAMKSRNKSELRAYKNLKSEIQLLQTAKNAKPYDDVAEIQLISKMCKKLEDDILAFSEACREDLVAEYRDELEVLKKLLPEPVNESQVYSELLSWAIKNKYLKANEDKGDYYLINITKAALPFLPKKEMGTAIKYLKSKFPQANGKMISNIVKEYIV